MYFNYFAHLLQELCAQTTKYKSCNSNRPTNYLHAPHKLLATVAYCTSH